jgi:2-(1,2-epoxy-1,2-dihydrophenyl)acetyl-CoA isomerase
MALLGEKIPAAQALEWGLINRAVADERLQEEVAALAQRLAAGPTLAYAAAKRQFNAWLYPRIADQLELEAQNQREMVETDDFAEGAMSFIEKRPAQFQGK